MLDFTYKAEKVLFKIKNELNKSEYKNILNFFQKKNDEIYFEKYENENILPLNLNEENFENKNQNNIENDMDDLKKFISCELLGEKIEFKTFYINDYLAFKVEKSKTSLKIFFEINKNIFVKKEFERIKKREENIISNSKRNITMKKIWDPLKLPEKESI